MSRVIQCELILPITAKFIRVCTMYVQCIPRQLARCLHRNEYDIWCNVCWDAGSWRYSVRFAHTAHASLMGASAPKRSANRALSWEGRGVLSGVNKLTTANLCDRKNADVGAMML